MDEIDYTSDDIVVPAKKLKLAEDVESQHSAADGCSKDDDCDIDMEERTLHEDDSSQVGFESLQSEMEQLKEFQVLDEVKTSNEESDGEESSSDSESESLPEEEIEKMLDEDLPEGFKATPKVKPYDQTKKIVFEEKGVNHFEILPRDWLVLTHNSGISLYLHKPTRVCTLSKPYFLGKGSVRKHEIPMSAIPCYNYKRALEEEEKMRQLIAESVQNNDKTNDSNKTDEAKVAQCERSIINNEDVATGKDEKSAPNTDGENGGSAENMCEGTEKQIEKSGEIQTEESVEKQAENSVEKQAEKSVETEGAGCGRLATNGLRLPVVLPNGMMLTAAKIETAQENWKSQHLPHEVVTEYCKRLFKYKTINLIRFKHWSDRRKYTKARKTLQRPTLPDGTKLITIPAQPSVSNGENSQGVLGINNKPGQREWIMNTNGRSYVCIFHEYVSRALQQQPTYEFKQLENAATPYKATVFINDMQYGVGYGTSKRQAKSAAAKASIEILIPEMRDKLSQDTKTNGTTAKQQEQDFAFFDYVGIEDPRITEFCTKTMEPSPHAILRTCLLRNFGIGDREMTYEMKPLKYQKIEFKMTVGKHTATVKCKNKKDGKQRASQAILQALHPHVKSWGSLLRLYGSRSVKSFKEKKLEEQEITLLQDKATANQPNYAILEKLRAEMGRLRERDSAVVSIGTLVVTGEGLPQHSGSNLNNVEL